MAKTRHHIRRLPEIEARDERYMAMRRAGCTSVEAAAHLGLTAVVRQRVEADYNAQYGAEQTRPANDDETYVKAVEQAGGFGRYLEVRTAEGKLQLVYVPYAVERRVMGARG